MKRRLFLKSLGVAATLSAIDVQAMSAGNTNGRPNIVLLMGDDHGWEETGYNGHPYVQTPVLDEMAAQGLRFDHFYSASPVCSPTRGSVMTGRHPNRYGTFSANWSLRPEEISIASVLSDAGYACGHFGKWHLGPVKESSPTNPGAMGFDEWLSHDNFFEMNPSFSRNGGPPEKIEGESSAICIEEAIKFIDQAVEKNQNYFVVVWFGSPHEPYSGDEEDLAQYDDLPEKYNEKLVRLTSMETGSGVKRPLNEVLQERYAEITAMDRSIGRLRKHLSQQGLRDNTLLWYCGDNGTPGGVNVASPCRGQKGQVYEGGIRVPGIIEWPKKNLSPSVIKMNAVTSDIFPTLCDLAGIPLPDRPLDGITLKPAMGGGLDQRPAPICFWNYETARESLRGKPYIPEELQEGTTPLVKLMAGKPTRTFRNYHHPNITEEDYAGDRAILDKQYKLVLINERRKELFDLHADPAEKINIIEQKPEIAEKLEKYLREWQKSVLVSLTGKDYLVK